MRLPLALVLALSFSACATDTTGAPEAAIRFGSGSQEELDLAEDLAYDSLLDETSGPLVGRGIEAFRTTKVHVDVTDMAHVKVQQLVGDVPVWEGEAIVHLTNGGAISAITDNLKDNVTVDPVPAFTADEAIDLAIGAVPDGWESLDAAPIADLWILRQDGADHLVWRVQFHKVNFRADDAMPVVFVDAHTGDIVWSYDNFQTVACSGTTNFYGSVALDCSTDGTLFYLEDTTELLGTYTYNNTTTSLYYLSDPSTTMPSVDEVDINGVEAHYIAKQVNTYFDLAHARNGIDGAGGPASTPRTGTASLRR